MRARWVAAAGVLGCAGLLAALTSRMTDDLRFRVQADLWLAVAGIVGIAASARTSGLRRGLGAALGAATCAFFLPRLEADRRFVAMCAYYGDAEAGPSYPGLAARAAAVLDADPGFADAALFAAGALAFDLGRPDEALALLRRASAVSPRDWRLPAAAGGLGSEKRGAPGAALSIVRPASERPGAPRQLTRLADFAASRTGGAR